MLLFLQLYNLAIRLYYFTILIASSRNEKAKQWIDGRKKLLKTVSGSLKNGESRIWFHCASVGEFEQARPLIEACKEKFPAYKIVLTFFSPSGYEFQKNYSGADYIFYLPLDTKRNAHEFISLVEPKLTVFVKYEFWFHFFNELVKQNIPTIMISVVLRKNHFLFSVFSAPLRKAVMNLNRVFVQDAHSAELLDSQGFSNAAIAGDTRFDRVWDIAFSPVLIPLIEKFKGEKQLFVAGSTWPADDRLILQLAASSHDEWKFIIVPHELNMNQLDLIKKQNPSSIFYSESKSLDTFTEGSILVVDQVGLLSSIYQYANMAYIGGGFGKGIHNSLEAAVYGIPVLFGPHYHKFIEARHLIELGMSRSIGDYNELKESFDFFRQPATLAKGEINREWIKEQTGATKRIMSYIESLNLNSDA